MNILPISDLHLEISNFTTPLPDVDAVVLAGDIGIGLAGVEWAKRVDKHVLYVLGNHEFEGHDYDKLLDQLREAAAKTDNVHLLQQNEVVIDGVRFLGCTMWTDFEIFGSHWKNDAKLACLLGMPEYATVYKNKKLLHISDTERMHHSDRGWLKMKLRTPFQGETVIVTHHAPHAESVLPKYRKNLLSAAFASDLTELLGRNSIWIHGHTHAGLDYEIDGTRIICNPRGYHKMANHKLPDFKLGKVIEIDNLNQGPNP